MIRKLVALSCVAFTAGALAQGTVNFDNTVAASGINAIVTLASDGSRLGTGFWAQLYAGPAGTAEGALTAVGVPVQFQVNASTGVALGSVNGGGVQINGIPAGGAAVVQMRAWDGRSGATSWEAAQAAGAAYGASSLLNLAATGNPLSSPPGTPVDLVGLQAFSITGVIPEPSTIALGVLGLAALALRRRK
jgi:hypothetical protein